MVEIRKAKYSDCSSIAKIHKENLDESFLGSLGERFLKNLYECLSVYEDGIILVAEENNKIVGFVCGTTHIGKFYRYFIRKKFIKVSFLLAIKMFDLITLKKIFEILVYPKKHSNFSLPEAELLSIAVEKNYHGKGVSEKLFKAFVVEFNRLGVDRFKIVVGDKLYRAKSFYKKMKCVKVGEIEIHEGENSEVYVYEKEREIY